ncbi:MAG: MoaD/ThiS family protein [Chloroflexi bacterium]|nr:MoaD/ThiS family protein [Chloroflexota bacterium]MBU1751016.1 MoaD/ThiS family protein [Chloroflexota bacterium]
MITVRVKLFATLRRYRPGLGIGEAFSVDLPAGATIEQLIAHLGLSGPEAKLIFVNVVSRDRAYVLAPGDDVSIFPPVGGG